MWRNKDFGQPVLLIAGLSAPGLQDHYLTDEKSGLPVAEVVF